MKIIVFDSWTGGVTYFHNIADEIQKAGFEFVFVHIGSWGSDKGRPAQEIMGKILVRDIRFYKNRTLTGILDYEKPDAVIFLSTHTFLHRAFNRYCRKRKIPTLHQYHGLYNVQVTNEKKGSYKKSKIAYGRFVLSKLPKVLFIVLPTYAKAMIKTGSTLPEWFRLIGDTIRLAVGRSSQKAAKDAKTDKCVVYTQADVEHPIRVYDFDPEDVIPVGNIDLIRFGLNESLIGTECFNNTKDRIHVIYIDTGLTALGLIFDDVNEYINHLKSTSGYLSENGYRLMLKPHPSILHQLDDPAIKKTLIESGIDIIPNDRLIEMLKTSAACIVETSTLALVPSLMGLPVFLANYGKLNAMRFGQVLRSYPRSYLLSNIEMFNETLKTRMQTPDQDLLRAWISDNAGPLPASDMATKVAELITSMARKK
jgi:hypothetical protein